VYGFVITTDGVCIKITDVDKIMHPGPAMRCKYVEMVKSGPDCRFAAYRDEEGLLHNAKPNNVGSHALAVLGFEISYLVGNIMITGPIDRAPIKEHDVLTMEKLLTFIVKYEEEEEEEEEEDGEEGGREVQSLSDAIVDCAMLLKNQPKKAKAKK
jgi:hypothetical protein